MLWHMNTTNRPAFSSLDAFKAHAGAEMKHWPMTSAMRWTIALAGVAMTVDYHRDGRVTFVGLW